VAATAPRRLATPSSVNAAIKQIADVMRRANYAGALQHVPELSWILFPRILDEREQLEAEDRRSHRGAAREPRQGGLTMGMPDLQSVMLPMLKLCGDGDETRWPTPSRPLPTIPSG
jgi:hypothetical protein